MPELPREPVRAKYVDYDGTVHATVEDPLLPPHHVRICDLVFTVTPVDTDQKVNCIRCLGLENR